MPQTQNPEVGGGKQDVQKAANELEVAAAAARQPRSEPVRAAKPDAEPVGVEFDDEVGQRETIPQYANEDEEFLFGMTDRPDEPVFNGAMPRRPQPPKDVMRYLGALADAAADPNAPQELYAFMRILQETLSE